MALKNGEEDQDRNQLYKGRRIQLKLPRLHSCDRVRHKPAHAHSMKKGTPLDRITHKQWRTIDPNTIGRMVGRKPTAVRQFQRLYDKPKGPRSPGSGRPAKLDVSQIDWTLSNYRNAKKLKCTPQRIGQIRKKLGKPNYVKTERDEDFC